MLNSSLEAQLLQTLTATLRDDCVRLLKEETWKSVENRDTSTWPSNSTQHTVDL
jgi:hypothetical protein